MRRLRDSNPRYVAVQQFSRLPPSTTRPSLQFVVELGLEPRQRGPESLVLPLHKLPIFSTMSCAHQLSTSDTPRPSPKTAGTTPNAHPYAVHASHPCFTSGRRNHGTSQPLRWCRQSEPFSLHWPGSAAINNFFVLPLSHSAQERPVCSLTHLSSLQCGAIHLGAADRNRTDIPCLEGRCPDHCATAAWCLER